MESVDWNAEAVAYADIERAKLPARIGAKASGEWGFAVLYGTGRYDTDEFTRRVLDELRKELDGLGFKVVGFGVDSEDGCTWAMLVDCQVMSEERLREVVLPI